MSELTQNLHKAVEEAVSQKEKPIDNISEELSDLLWQNLIQLQGQTFLTAKNLEFTYIIKGGEMFVSRKDKSITKATAVRAFEAAVRILKNGERVSGPKKLGTFGASYLYPVFEKLGVFDGQAEKQNIK